MLSEATLGFVIFIIPALIYGILVAIPFLVFVLYQSFSHRYFPNLDSFALIVASISSFAVALLFTTRSIINFSYAIEIPHGYLSEIPKNEADKKIFDSAVINEATYRSLIPIYFQKPCTRMPEIVCQLGARHAINLWDSHDILYRMPIVSGIVSALVSVLIVFWVQNNVNIRFDEHCEEMLA